MPLVLFFIAFIVVPFVELWLILWVTDNVFGGGKTGAALVIALLIGSSLLGAFLLRSQGRAVWGQFRETLDAGRLPAREVIDGMFVIVGGVLLMTPGFISDVFGLMMLLPPTRRVFGGWAMMLLSTRVTLAFKLADTGLRNFPRSNRAQSWDYEADDVVEHAQDTALAPPKPPALTDGDDYDFDFETKRPPNQVDQ